MDPTTALTTARAIADLLFIFAVLAFIISARPRKTTNTQETWDHGKTLRTFANEPREVHALGLGIFAAFRRIRAGKIPDDYPETSRAEIEAEYPYYLTGFYIGRAIQVGLALTLGWAFY